MKSLVVLFNCHGMVMINQLKMSKEICDTFNIRYIQIYDYLERDFESDKYELLINADVIILQYIKNMRPYIHHSIIKSIIKPDCQLIMLPHYVFSGYWVKHVLPEDFNSTRTAAELEQIIDTFNIDSNIIIENFDNSLIELKNLESECDINMYDIMLKYAKQHRMFNSRGYPTHMFFYFASLELLKLLNVNADLDNFELCPGRFAYNIRMPILPIVTKTLNLEFNEVSIEPKIGTTYSNIYWHLLSTTVNYINFDESKTDHLELLDALKKNVK